MHVHIYTALYIKCIVIVVVVVVVCVCVCVCVCVSTLCLIGKILNDSQPLSEYKIQENSFVVVMVSRVKAKPPEVSSE